VVNWMCGPSASSIRNRQATAHDEMKLMRWCDATAHCQVSAMDDKRAQLSPQTQTQMQSRTLLVVFVVCDVCYAA
jgi:hypothetical protein